MTRRHLLAALALAPMLLAGALASACGGDGGEEFPEVVLLGDGDVFPSINNSSLAVGTNRVSLSLIDADDEPVLGADVRLRFFDLTGSEPVETESVPARWQRVELGYVDEQSGGAREVTGETGVYIAEATFSHAGSWGVKVRVTVAGETFDEAPYRFNVLERSSEPMVGEDAPRTVQQTLATAASIEDIDSSAPPRPDMHDTTIAEAVTSGEPAVIAFATPAYCRSRICAPVMDAVMDPLAEEFAGRAAFIHVEPFVLADLRAGFVQNPVPATREWRIESEPWMFVVGRDGRIAAKFEGVAGLDEVRDALNAALAAP